MRTPLALLAGLALALPVLATPGIAAAPPPGPNPFNQQLLKLGLADRNGALRRAVTMENLPCGRLSDSLPLGQYGNLGRWQVRCTPGGDYTVFTGPDGSVQVRPCGDLAALKLPQCVAFPAPAQGSRDRGRPAKRG